MSKSKKHVFFIEGGDNVGKTTTIQALKDSGMIDSIKYNRISFSKYPNSSITDTINNYIQQIKSIDESYNQNQINRWNYVKEKKKLLNDISNLMIDDMEYSFTNQDDSIYHIKYPDDVCNICDRGPLSTYLYQYRSRPDIPNILIGASNEIGYLKDFFESYILSRGSENEMSIVILNNNANLLLSNIIIDDSETIEYKKQYDLDVKLQTRINSSINNIVGMIENGSIKQLLPIKFYYINIFDDTGSIRKSTNDICKELISIINKEE